MVKLSQVYDGLPITVPIGRSVSVGCCDCGLVHEVSVTGPRKRKYLVTYVRNNKTTGAVRRTTGLAPKKKSSK